LTPTIALCGSMVFYPRMKELASSLEKDGWKVFLPESEEGKLNYADLPFEKKREQKKTYIDAHLAKIRNSQAILVVNEPKHGIEGYVGANTLMEIAFAYALGRSIYLLNPVCPQPCQDELLGLGARSLPVDQDLSSFLRSKC
jgi:hypothetical protein